jgi:MinD-like ATPase involved in chromosome partitioning or flagellar assembly
MSKIISIHSFRGGTGKSNITANVAVIVAQRGYRVGIIDTDIQSPGIHVLFDLDEEKRDKSLNDYLWGRCTIEETAYDVGATLDTGEREATAIDGCIFLIPASLSVGAITRVLREGYDAGLLTDGLREMVRQLDLDYLFIDTHPGLNHETLLSIAISDVLVIMLRPDQQDYQGTGVTVDVARKLDVPQMFLVVNKVLPSFDFADVREEMEETYECPVAAILPLSEDVMRLGSEGIFCLQHPDHPFTQGIEEIAVKVLEE